MNYNSAGAVLQTNIFQGLLWRYSLQRTN